MLTIQAYGYEVTGSNDIIIEIDKDLKDPKTKINWERFSNNDKFWNYDGSIGYPVSIDHVAKKVYLGL